MKGRRIPYSAEELRFIQAHCGMMRRDLVAAFSRKFSRDDVTAEHIKSLCTRHGWTNGRQPPWLAEQDELLRVRYADTPTDELAQLVGHTLIATYSRAKKLGLQKSGAYLEGPKSGRLQRGQRIGVATEFKKGQIPATKGVRRPGWHRGRMKETQFTKEHVSWNQQPLGTERIKMGYRFTKVSDRRGAAWAANWRQTHILRWEEVNGPLPTGMVLKCLSDDRLNVDPSNWEAIPRGVLPRLAGTSGRDYGSAPAELKPTIMAIAKLEHAAYIARPKAKRRKARTA